MYPSTLHLMMKSISYFNVSEYLAFDDEALAISMSLGTLHLMMKSIRYFNVSGYLALDDEKHQLFQCLWVPCT